MTHRLILNIPDDAYQPLSEAAALAGQTPEQWLLVRLSHWVPRQPLSNDQHEAALARLLEHAGAADLGHSTGADNPRIDEDLAAEYGSSHDGNR